MTTSLHGKMTVFGDENLKDTSYVGRVGGLNAARRADFLLFSIPNPECRIGAWIMKMVFESRR
jgi:hypothetical protein